jgi:hypothetical protein
MGVSDGIFGSGGAASSQAAVDVLKDVPLPVLKQMYPELYQQLVNLNPNLEKTSTLTDSALSGVSSDPRLKQAQMNALSKLQDITSNNGRDAQFQSGAAQVANDVNSNLKGNEDAITQNLAARGMSGGLSEMVQRQQAAQGAANRQSQSDLDLNAQAQQRALSSIMSQGQLGGQMQAQDFNQQAQVAASQDAISKFNAANSQDVSARNASTINNTNQVNATNAQNISNSNVQTKNAAQQYNLGLNQQNYNNAIGKANLVSNAYESLAASQDRAKSGDMALVGGLVSGAATGGAGMATKKAQG